MCLFHDSCVLLHDDRVQVVHLASEAFHYHANDRMKIRMRRFATEQWPDTIGKRVSQDLPLKVYHRLASSILICINKQLKETHINQL